MGNRLPKQFWRVNVIGQKARVYDRGSKTYASEAHAESARAGFVNAGYAVEVWTTGPVTWELVSADVKVEGQEELF